MQATYSPDDNKLRLYAAGRLDQDTYNRLRAAGFQWAPRQSCFVAPAWTPEREDLLLELAGEIEDDDTTLLERAEQRAERFDGYRERRSNEAEAARAAVARIADAIPFGQPILIGHHSERRARRDAERIQNGMRRAVQLWRTAEYWQERAAAALRHAKYKERPDVRARRIKKLEAEHRHFERRKTEAATFLRLWESLRADRADFLECARKLADHDHVVVNRTDGRHWTAWDVLRPEGERNKDCPVMTPEDVRAACIETHKRAIAWCDRWLAHLANRLTYERAMLAAAGGIPADRVRPEAGGACRCWASPRGGWAYIVKVNRVSVTVLDNWGNGGPNFTRTIPFDKLTELMSRAEVEEARAAGRLVETEDKTGFFLKPVPAPASAPTPEACAQA